MTLIDTVLIVLLFFVTTAIGVVTGSNSLVTVPVMFEMGIDPKRAIATNMFGLTFMALGATVPFYRQGLIDVKKLWPLTLLTILGSAAGATLVGFVSSSVIPTIVSVSMIAIGLFMLIRPAKGVEHAEASDWKIGAGVIVIGSLMAIYGGFYSGGYMTVMTAVFVAFAGMKFSEAIAGTKFLNLFSSLIATIVFIWQGFVDFRLGAILAVTMFVAAYVGAKTIAKIDEKWLRIVFLSAVFLLAIHMIFF